MYNVHVIQFQFTQNLSAIIVFDTVFIFILNEDEETLQVQQKYDLKRFKN